MTKPELTLVWEKADDPNFITSIHNFECDGIAFWDEKKPVTLDGAVSFVRWQAQNIIGEDRWDWAMLQESLIYLQKKAILLSSQSPKQELPSEVTIS